MTSAAADSQAPVTTDTMRVIENYRLCLQKLLINWKTVSGGYEIPAHLEGTARMVIPWAAQVHRFGRAYLQLEKVALEHEGHVLVRSALEYTVVAHWAAKVGHNAVVARYGQDQRLLRALANDLKQTGSDVVPSQWTAELFAEGIDADPVPTVDEARLIGNFESVCRDVGVHNTLYPVYRVMCWFTHPTTHAAGIYLDGDAIAVNPDAAHRPLALVGLMAHAVYWSRRTVDDLTVNHPYADWLDELAHAMNVVPRLPDPQSTGPATEESPATTGGSG
jgi:hypothetical protein